VADDVGYTPGSGATIAADDVGPGVLYQRVKVSLGADGTAVDLNGDSTGGLWAQGPAAADAAVAGNPLYVGARGSTALPTAVSADGDAVGLWASLNGALNVIIRDTAGAAVSTGTQYAEDSALGTTGTGTLVVARRDDALATLTPVEDDAIGLRVNNRGALWTKHDGNIVADAGTGPWPVTDNADSLTVDSPGIPTALGQATMAASMPVAIASNQSGVPVTGTFWQATQPVSGTVTANAGTGPWPVTDNAGSLTVDQATASLFNAQVVGPVAVDVPAAGNPLFSGARASTAQPTAMSADGDMVGLWANRRGALVVANAPHVGLNSSPWQLASFTAQFTSTLTSALMVTASASQQIVVTGVQIQAGGTTAGAVQLYLGTGAYSRGTTPAIFDGEFAPSSTNKPGVVMTGPFIGAADADLRITTSAAINPLTVTVWYYLVS